MNKILLLRQSDLLAVSTNYTRHNFEWPSLNRQNCAALTHGIGNVLFPISSVQFRNADACMHVGEPPGPIKSTRLFWLAVRLLTCYRLQCGRGQLKCDGTCAESRFCLRRNRQGRQFSQLLAAEVRASAVVMLDTPCSEVVWKVLATHSIRQFPLHCPSRASPCAITFQLESTTAVCQMWPLLLALFIGHLVRNTNFYWPNQSASLVLYRLLAILGNFLLYCVKFSPYGMATEVSVADPSQVYDLSPTQTFRIVNSFF
jgi:hypothetical protein